MPLTQDSTRDELVAALRRGEALPADAAVRYAQIMCREAVAHERETIFEIMKQRANAMMSFADPGNQWNAYASGCITSMIAEIKDRTE